MNLSSRLRNFLYEPYPYYFVGRSLWWLVGVLFILAVFFEVAFRPFGVYDPEHRIPHVFIAIVHSTVACATLIICATSLRYFPKFREQWTVGKDIVFLGTFLFLTGVGQFLVRDLIYINPDNWSLHYLLEEVRNTFLTGMLFILILVPLNQARLSRRNQQKARNLSLNQQPEPEPMSVSIHTDLKGDDFMLRLEDFLFARAEGNYVSLYSEAGTGVERSLKRIKISDLERQLQNAPGIFRCHRSFLVNLDAVREIKGNAQGYRLQLRNTDEVVLVSRSMIPGFERQTQMDR